MSVFVDSTTLLYPLDATEPAKGAICETWLKALRGSDRMALSAQILNESYWTVMRKPPFEAARPIIRELLSEYRRWCRAPLDAERTFEAWTLQDRYGVAFWDALALSSANAAGCTWFLSEDLNDGQLYGSVRAVNPFHHAPQDVLSRARSR